jgi:hypothetical protein
MSDWDDWALLGQDWAHVDGWATNSLDQDVVADSSEWATDETEQDPEDMTSPGDPSTPPAATTTPPEAQLPATSVERDGRLSSGTTGEEQLYVSPHVCAFWAGPVLERFFGMIHQMPTKAALIKLREQFPFTGGITNEERRSLRRLAASFEPYADQIKTRLEDPEVLRRVVKTLEENSHRHGDKDDAKIHAGYFLAARGLA